MFLVFIKLKLYVLREIVGNNKESAKRECVDIILNEIATISKRPTLGIRGCSLVI